MFVLTLARLRFHPGRSADCRDLSSAGGRLREEEVLARMISQLFRPVHHKNLENSTLCKQNLMDVGVYNLSSDAREQPRGLAREWKWDYPARCGLAGEKN